MEATTSDPENLNVVSGYQIPFHSVPVQLHVPVTKCSDLTVPLVNAEVNKLLSMGAIKEISFSKDNFYSRLFLLPKKRNLPPGNRPEPSEQIHKELPFPNGKHFLSEDTSQKGRPYDMHRPKGCISLRPRTRVLTKLSMFPTEKQVLYIPRPSIWSKYSSQGINKAKPIAA